MLKAYLTGLVLLALVPTPRAQVSLSAELSNTILYGPLQNEEDSWIPGISTAFRVPINRSLRVGAEVGYTRAKYSFPYASSDLLDTNMDGEPDLILGPVFVRADYVTVSAPLSYRFGNDHIAPFLSLSPRLDVKVGERGFWGLDLIDEADRSVIDYLGLYDDIAYGVTVGGGLEWETTLGHAFVELRGSRVRIGDDTIRLGVSNVMENVGRGYDQVTSSLRLGIVF